MGKNVIVAKQNVTVAKKVANVATVLPARINVLAGLNAPVGKNVIVAKQNVTVAKKVANVATVLPAGINAPVATNVLATSLKQEKNANAKKDAKLNNIAITQ